MIGISDVIPILVFLGIVLAIWAVLSMISNRNSHAAERLARLSRPQSLAELEDPSRARGDHKLQGLLDAAKSFSRPLMPSTELEQSALKTKLANAGFRSDAAPMVYSGLRLLCLGVSLVIALAVFVPGRPFGFRMILMIAMMTCLGFYVPSLILWYMRSKRQQDIFLT